MPDNKACSSAPKWVFIIIAIILLTGFMAYLIWFEVAGAKKPHSDELVRLHSKMFLRTMILIISFAAGYGAGYGLSQL